jgi:hypothetical protein
VVLREFLTQLVNTLCAEGVLDERQNFAKGGTLKLAYPRQKA